MPKMPALLGHDDFFIRERRARHGIPVDHPFAMVNQTLLVEIYEHTCDAAGVFRVHREAFAGPIAGAPEFPELLNDNAAVLFFPFPDFLEEFFAAQIVAMLDRTLLLERAFDYGL